MNHVPQARDHVPRTLHIMNFYQKFDPKMFEILSLSDEILVFSVYISYNTTPERQIEPLMLCFLFQYSI